MVKIIHGADFHLDSPFSGLTPQQAAQRRGEQRELLDHLANLVNCEYISDLRYRVSAAAMGCALRSIPAEAFPSEQWCETASYLMGKDCVPEDRADCRQQLLAYYLARRQKK